MIFISISIKLYHTETERPWLYLFCFCTYSFYEALPGEEEEEAAEYRQKCNVDDYCVYLFCIPNNQTRDYKLLQFFLKSGQVSSAE